MVGARAPVAVCNDGTVLVDPSRADLMGKLGFRTDLDVRACRTWSSSAPGGPVWRPRSTQGSEGLSTLVLEPCFPAGRRAQTSLIRNYLGFPHGLSGEDLTNRATEQAWLLPGWTCRDHPGSRADQPEGQTELCVRPVGAC